MESQENQYRWPKAEAIYPDRQGVLMRLSTYVIVFDLFYIKAQLFTLSNLLISILFLLHY